MMKHRSPLAICLAVLMSLPAAADVISQASACHTVGDADARAACLARAHRDPSRCGAVQQADLRARCRAEAQR